MRILFPLFCLLLIDTIDVHVNIPEQNSHVESFEKHTHLVEVIKLLFLRENNDGIIGLVF